MRVIRTKYHFNYIKFSKLAEEKWEWDFLMVEICAVTKLTVYFQWIIDGLSMWYICDTISQSMLREQRKDRISEWNFAVST